MKVDRVILSSNANPVYYHFWNPLSKVYKEKFGIRPTLLWIGTEQELADCGLSKEYGDIIVRDAHPDYHIPWQTTWGCFWLTQFYPEDTCLLIGIDQVPLSGMFIRDMISEVDENAYAMLIDDAYLPNNWTSTASPSSYHIAKGKVFNEVYKFDKDFKAEMTKLHQSGINGFWESTEGRWGIDESYSCAKLREYKGLIKTFSRFGLLVERRIECERHKETPYDKDKLRAGWYSESHLCRPYTNHVNYINEMFDSIPNYQ